MGQVIGRTLVVAAVLAGACGTEGPEHKPRTDASTSGSDASTVDSTSTGRDGARADDTSAWRDGGSDKSTLADARSDTSTLSDSGSDTSTLSDSGSDAASARTRIPQVWPKSTPQAQGIHPDLIDEIGFMMREDKANGVLIKNGHLVAQWNSLDPDTRVDVQSIAKSFVALLLGVALKQGRIASLDDKVIDYHPEFGRRGFKYADRVTFRHLGNMTSGIATTLAWEHRDLKRDVPPGTQFEYTTHQNYLLGDALTEVFGRKLDRVLHDEVLSKINASDIELRVGTQTDTRGNPVGSYSIRASAKDVAKAAQLFINKGWGNGAQRVSQGFVARTFASISVDLGYDAETLRETWKKYAEEAWIPYMVQLDLDLGSYRYGINWWKIGPGWYMSGRGMQSVQVWPEHDMILVKLNDWHPPHKYDTEWFTPLLKAAAGEYELKVDSARRVRSFTLTAVADAGGRKSGEAYCAAKGLQCLSVDRLWTKAKGWLGFESDGADWYAYSCKEELLSDARYGGKAKLVNCYGRTDAASSNEVQLFGIQIGANAKDKASVTAYCSAKGLEAAGVDWLYAEKDASDVLCNYQKSTAKWWCRFGTQHTRRAHYSSKNAYLTSDTDLGRQVTCVGKQQSINDQTHAIHRYYLENAGQAGGQSANQFCWARGMSCLGVEWLFGDDCAYDSWCTHDELQGSIDWAEWKHFSCNDSIRDASHDELVRVVTCRRYPSY